MGWFDTAQNFSDILEQMKEVLDALELRRENLLLQPWRVSKNTDKHN